MMTPIEKIGSNIYKLTLGPFWTNNYLIIKNNQSLLIDCTSSYEICELIKSLNCQLIGIILTHGHIDHTSAVKKISQKFNLIPYMNSQDDIQLKIAMETYQEYGFTEYEMFEYQHIDEGDLIIGDFRIKVIHTPGHTQGSCCFLYEDILFSGDTIFRESIGRTDLPGGSFELILSSIHSKILPLDDNILVLPGHGPITSIKHEKKYNPFVNAYS
ncbi:MAG: MBL fold metallo-hydrolase [bacterium]